MYLHVRTVCGWGPRVPPLIIIHPQQQPTYVRTYGIYAPRVRASVPRGGLCRSMARCATILYYVQYVRISVRSAPVHRRVRTYNVVPVCISGYKRTGEEEVSTCHHDVKHHVIPPSLQCESSHITPPVRFCVLRRSIAER